jgi:exopolyphosphatase/guanosine-5'-triphosphate,3'-diphosphate pyrophosphatase
MPKQRAQRVAVIDLGSNTNRLIVLNTQVGYSYRLEDQVREVVRLRHGMTEGGLSAEAFERGFSTLRLFKNFCDSTHVSKIIAFATSAVREAANGPLFVGQVRDEIGVELQVLTGEREAYYDTLGALNEVSIQKGVVLDIGGGSIQLSEVRKRRFHQGIALTLGALALTERFVTHDPVTKGEYAALQEEIECQLDTIKWLKKQAGEPLIGLGGTIRNLAQIQAENDDYPLLTLHGFVLKRESVEDSIKLFRKLPVEERKDIPGLTPDRADIILPGAMTLLEVMKRMDVEEIAVSQNGVREGVFLEYFWEHLDPPILPDVRRFSVLNLARFYNYEKEHSNHVRYLAERIFLQLTPLHGYDAGVFELLDAAALLHDIGRIIDYRGHHKHSQTLVENNGLPGFSPRELALIGLLTRYHRKGDPSIDGYELLLDEDDQTLLTRLSAILRMAETLERGRNANVNDVIVTWDDEELRLTLITDFYPSVELWQAERNAAPLMAAAFEREIRLDSFAPPIEHPIMPGEEDTKNSET